MGWLMSDALNSSQRAQWVYNHRDQMDDSRYNELIKHDAKLQAELDVLKQQNAARDPNYVPDQFKSDPDLMYAKSDPGDIDYSDTFRPGVPYKADVATIQSGSWGGWVLFFSAIILGCIAVWLIFIKEWK